jgi:phenylalanyl-tRNA synthetase beta chain
MARELAAIYGRPLRPLCEPASLPRTGHALPVAIEDRAACPRYCGLLIEGVRSLPSPSWLRWLLLAVGQRTIELSVDLTNFVMLDLGQPMHAFDRRFLDQQGVGVRFAKPGETLATLDQVERRLTGDDLVITSGGRPVALAGIMGGAGSMVTPDTSELFLESANFKASVVRRTSGRLGLRTESSARFEKSLDPTWAELGVHRFVGLLGELCPGARPAGPLADPAGWAYTPRSIHLRKSRLDLKLGHEIAAARVAEILTGLQFGVAATEGGFDVAVPSFRATKDITIEDDLIEEVGRMFRYDNIPEQPLSSVVAVPPREPELWLARALARQCALELACNEVYDYSFVPDQVVAACLAEKLAYTRVRNPVAPELARVRRRVLPSLLQHLQRNLEVAPEVRLFEDGRGYDPNERDADGLPAEVHEIAVVFARRAGRHPYADLREGIASVLSRVGHRGEMVEAYASSNTPWAHPGRSVAIRRADRRVGFVGALHPQVCRNLGVPATVAVASLDLRQLLASGVDPVRYRPISPYPTQAVDVALLVDRGVPVGDVAAFLRGCGKLVQSVELFEVYAGEGLPAGKKSVNFTVVLGSAERTLTQKDEEKYLGAVREGAASIGAELRG